VGKHRKWLPPIVADESVARQIPLLLSFGGFFLQLDFRRLSRVNDELLKLPPIDKLLLLEGLTVEGAMTHPIIECTIVACSGALRVMREWFRVPHLRLVLDSTEDAVDGDLEQSEVG